MNLLFATSKETTKVFRARGNIMRVLNANKGHAVLFLDQDSESLQSAKSLQASLPLHQDRITAAPWVLLH